MKIRNEVNVLKRYNSDSNKIESLGTNLSSHKVSIRNLINTRIIIILKLGECCWSKS